MSQRHLNLQTNMHIEDTQSQARNECIWCISQVTQKVLYFLFRTELPNKSICLLFGQELVVRATLNGCDAQWINVRWMMISRWILINSQWTSNIFTMLQNIHVSIQRRLYLMLKTIDWLLQGWKHVCQTTGKATAVHSVRAKNWMHLSLHKCHVCNGSRCTSNLGSHSLTYQWKDEPLSIPVSYCAAGTFSGSQQAWNSLLRVFSVFSHNLAQLSGKAGPVCKSSVCCKIRHAIANLQLSKLLPKRKLYLSHRVRPKCCVECRRCLRWPTNNTFTGVLNKDAEAKKYNVMTAQSA